MSHKYVDSVEARENRKAIRKVPCPTCGAAPGVNCFTVRRSGVIYVRAASHAARWAVWRELEKKAAPVERVGSAPRFNEAAFLTGLNLDENRETYRQMTPEQRQLVRFGYYFGFGTSQAEIKESE